MVVNAAFWKHRKVFLTGHTGFKGSWLSLWLYSLGARVTGYALQPPSNPSLFEVARVPELVRSVIGDVRDSASLSQCMRDCAPEVVLHMAAQPLVRRSYADPVETYSTNVMGTVNLLEALRRTPSVRAAIIVTTDKCYENREWVWGYRENEPMGGYDPYSSSKGCAELVTGAYRSSFFNPGGHTDHRVALASARAGNVIGGGDWAEDRLIPDILKAFEKSRPVVIRSPGSIRPWQHVLEPLGGYLLLAEKLYEAGGECAEAWNFGPNDADAKPVRWMVEQLVQQWGDGANWTVPQLGEQPHESVILKLDCSKAKSRLGWQPRWALAETLNSIVAWHKAYLDGRDMRDVTLRQIAQYSQQLT